MGIPYCKHRTGPIRGAKKQLRIPAGTPYKAAEPFVMAPLTSFTAALTVASLFCPIFLPLAGTGAFASWAIHKDMKNQTKPKS